MFFKQLNFIQKFTQETSKLEHRLGQDKFENNKCLRRVFKNHKNQILYNCIIKVEKVDVYAQ